MDDAKMDAILFHFGFEEIRIAYRASMDGFNRAFREAEETVKRQYGLPIDAPLPEIEYDEVGPTTPDWGEAVGEAEFDARTSQELVRTAFVVALFHFWERQSNSWLGVQRYDHQSAMTWLRQRGVEPREEVLRLLELTANCAKHGPGPSCNRLHEVRTDLFDLVATGDTAPSDTALRITAELTDEFFDAVFRSGPPTRAPWSA